MRYIWTAKHMDFSPRKQAIEVLDLSRRDNLHIIGKSSGMLSKLRLWEQKHRTSQCNGSEGSWFLPRFIRACAAR